MALNDVKRAYWKSRALYRSWRDRRELERHLAAAPPPPTNDFPIGVYFADAPVNLYQVRQWYGPLTELAKTHPVVLISRSPRTFIELTAESPLPVVYLQKILDFEQFITSRNVKTLFYVNQNARNFQAMRYNNVLHVLIGHGESDKDYMRTNQHKAYDFAFIAGQAAADRLKESLWGYNVDKRTIRIGRPQVDHFGADAPFPSDGRTTVFYAPTWEGDRETMAYGSVMTHGERLAAAVLASPRHRLVYRPHPRSGVARPEYGKANQRIIDAIARANAADPSAGHIYDTSGEIGWQLSTTDIAITDISAMIYDRLATGRAILVTKPVHDNATVHDDGYLSSCEWLEADRADDILAVIDETLADASARERLEHWVEHYFGDTTPGAATTRFHAAVQFVLTARESFTPTGSIPTLSADADEEDDPDESLPA